MKHKLDGPVYARVDLEFNKDDVEDIIDRITESVVIIIVVASAAHILKSRFER